MPLRYKVNVLSELKKAGYSSYSLLKGRGDALLSASTVQKLRKGEGISWDNLERICGLLKCQPGELIEWTPEEWNNGQSKSNAKE